MSTLSISPQGQQEKVSLVEALLPEKIRKELQEAPTELTTGAVDAKVTQIRAVATLIIHLIQRSDQFFFKGMLNKFDCITGAFDCESRAAFFHKLLSDETFKEELRELSKKCKPLRKSLTQFNPSYLNIITDKENNLFKLFFTKVLQPLKISKKVAFLFRSLILTSTRVPTGKPDENGVITTKLDPNQLSNRLISRKLKLGNNHCKELVYTAAADLSKQTLEEIHSMTKDLKDFEGKTLTLQKLKEIKKKEREGHKSLSVAPLFYRVRAVMEYIKQKGAVVIMKNIVPKGEESFYLAMKGGEKFSLIHEEDFQKMEVFTPLIIFTAVVRKGQTKEAFVKKMNELGGFEQLIILSAAADSQIEDNKIEDYREKADKNNIYRDKKDPFFFIDHVYCNTKGSEFPKRKIRRK